MRLAKLTPHDTQSTGSNQNNFNSTTRAILFQHFHLEMYPISYNEFIAFPHTNVGHFQPLQIRLQISLLDSHLLPPQTFWNFHSSWSEQISDLLLEVISITGPGLVSLTTKGQNYITSSEFLQISSHSIMAVFDICKDTKARHW